MLFKTLHFQIPFAIQNSPFSNPICYSKLSIFKSHLLFKTLHFQIPFAIQNSPFSNPICYSKLSIFKSHLIFKTLHFQIPFDIQNSPFSNPIRYSKLSTKDILRQVLTTSVFLKKKKKSFFQTLLTTHLPKALSSATISPRVILNLLGREESRVLCSSGTMFSSKSPENKILRAVPSPVT